MSAPDIWLEGEVVEELCPVEEEGHGGHEEGGGHEDQVQHVVVLPGHGNQVVVTVDPTRYTPQRATNSGEPLFTLKEIQLNWWEI